MNELQEILNMPKEERAEYVRLLKNKRLIKKPSDPSDWDWLFEEGKFSDWSKSQRDILKDYLHDCDTKD